MKKINLNWFFIFSIFFLEIIIHYACFNNFSIQYTLFFNACFALILGGISQLLPSKNINKIIFYFLILIISILYIAQLIYFKIYESFFNIFAIFMSGQVTEASDQIFWVTVDNLKFVLPCTIPFIISLLLYKKFNFEKTAKIEKKFLIGFACVYQLLGIFFVNQSDNQLISNENVYYSISNPTTSVERFGVFTFLRLDLQKNLFGVKNHNTLITNIEVNSSNIEPSLKYNKINIDWEKIIEQEKDKETKQIHQYISSLTPTKKNEYTGMFEGKNVIFILAESLYAPIISEELTPTLYKMQQEGFQFNNYYVPLYPSSTADGEYMLESGLLPIIGNTYNLINSSKNYNPYSFVNTFTPLDYKVSAYHGYTSAFYNRKQYFKNMGFEHYGFCDTNLNITCHNMHASDLDMVKNSINNFINEDSFFTYYISISGHGNYDDNNFIAKKNWDAVKDLKYSNHLKRYIASNIELDKALEYLMQKLEEAGKLEDTVFIISPDHWPYYFKTRIEELETIAGNSIYDKFELHKNSLIIYNSSMEEPIQVDKVTTNIDVLPTLLNLMGVEYDSRLLVGTDALSDSNGLVIFSDYSWISDFGKYDGKAFESNNTNINLPANYIDNINTIVNQRVAVSNFIQKNNYYKILFDAIDKQKKKR